ncbi:MAG: right-handed parallel beta-helix repeat-containing protein [Flavobacteriales bacterium]
MQSSLRAGFTKLPFVLSTVLLIGAFSPLHATVYFVSVATGDDNNPGTELQPWYTIEKATTVLVAGDTALVKAGEYELSGTNTRYIPALNPTNSGTPGNPIVFKTYCADMVALVQHDVGGPLIGSYDRDYIVWDGFIVHEATTYQEFPETEHNVCVMWSGTGCVIQNCEVVGALNTLTTDNHVGIRVEDSVDPIIRNCTIHGVKNASGQGHGYGVENFSAGTTVIENLLVENCEIYNCGVGIGNHEGGVNNIYRKNYIHDCTVSGIGMGSQNGSSTMGGKIYQNLIVDIGEQSIFLTPPSDTPMIDYEIYNNTVVTSTGTDVGEISFSYAPGISIWNNVVVQAGSNPRLVTERYNTTSNISYMDHNSYDVDGQFVLGLYSSSPTVYNSLADWTSNTVHDANSFIADPLFVSAPTNDFHLQAGSPCLLAGIDRQDHNGNGNFTEAVNMGAYIQATDTIGTFAVGHPDCAISVGTEAITNETVATYPNPTTGLVQLVGVRNATIVITDVHGKVLDQRRSVVGDVLDLSHLSNGVYFVTVRSEGGLSTGRVVKW